MIKRPLLAETIDSLDEIVFPCYATPKIDGIRALKLNDDLVSRQLKPIRNEKIREILRGILPNGSDGEISMEGTFQDITSNVMSKLGTANFDKKFMYYWFDYVSNSLNKPYLERMEEMREYIERNPEIMGHEQVTIVPLYPKRLDTIEQVQEFEKNVLSENFEGMMIRRGDGKYKTGRSTKKEGILLKIKKFEDDEAKIVDFQELMHNTNELNVTETGENKRSQRKEGKVLGGKLGAFIVESKTFGKFNIGSGFTDEMRVTYWNEREVLKGKLVKFKYFMQGSKEAPRFPVFLGLRDVDDM